MHPPTHCSSELKPWRFEVSSCYTSWRGFKRWGKSLAQLLESRPYAERFGDTRKERDILGLLVNLSALLSWALALTQKNKGVK